MHVFTAQLFAFSLCGSSWLRPSRPSRNMVTACNNSSCPVVLLVLRLDKASLAQPQTVSLVAQYVPQLLDGLQALASLPTNHWAC